jgi:hypothetical protein
MTVLNMNVLSRNVLSRDVLSMNLLGIRRDGVGEKRFELRSMDSRGRLSLHKG